MTFRGQAITALLLALLSSFSCSPAPSSPPSSPAALGSRDVEVLRAVVQAILVDLEGKAVIGQTTLVGDPATRIGREDLLNAFGDALPEDLCASFFEAYETQASLDAAILEGVRDRVQQAQPDQLDRLVGFGYFGRDPQTEASFPGVGNRLDISRPGFSSDGSRALVRTWVACGGLCGLGRFLLLEQRREGWVVVRNVTYGAS